MKRGDLVNVRFFDANWKEVIKLGVWLSEKNGSDYKGEPVIHFKILIGGRVMHFEVYTREQLERFVWSV